MVDLSMLDAVKAAAGEKPAAPPVAEVDGYEGVIEGKVFTPPRILAYGLDGIGKSTFACQSPKPMFIQTGKDLEQLGPRRFPLATSYEMVVTQLNTVIRNPKDRQTIVIDHLTGLEELIWKKLCNQYGKRTIGEIGGGFAKGEKAALTEWAEILGLLDKCVERGLAVILTAHQGKEDAGNPEVPMLKVIGPSVDKHASLAIRKWVDATIYFTRRMIVSTVGQGIMEKPIAKAVGADGGERIMVCNGSPMLHAKNRYGLPTELPLPKEGSFNTLMSYVAAHFSNEKKG